jgi:hypothetical protein
MSRRKEIFKEADLEKKIDDVEKAIVELREGLDVLETLHSPTWSSGYKADGWYFELHDELKYKVGAMDKILSLSKDALVLLIKKDEEKPYLWNYGRNMEWCHRYKSKKIEIWV